MAIFDSIRLGASGTAEDYEIERSLRFNPAHPTHLTRTPSSAGNQNTWTFSVWLKRGKLGTSLGYIYRVDGSHTDRLEFDSSDRLFLQQRDTNIRISTQKFRDISAWYHIVIAMDTTQGTADNRTKVYVNGEEVTAFDTKANNSQNTDGMFNSTNEHKLGGKNANQGFDGYMAEINFINGSQLTPESFGETNTLTGQWNPKKYTGSYGTNGFYLNFSDNSGTSATTLGKDSSGNGNNFTPTNFDVGTGDDNDCKTDTPTNSIATLNPQTGFTYNATLKNGNLEMTGSGGFKEISTIAVAGTSKFYYELVRTISAGWQLVGVFVGQPDNPSNALSNSAIWGFASTQATYFGGNYTSTNDVPSWTTNDVMGIKYENGTLKLYKNGTLATATTSSIPTDDIVFAYIANDNTNSASYVRFNSDDWTQGSNAGVDSTWALSKANMPDPAIAKSTDHFDILLWSGTGSTHNITGLDFQPDWVWVKKRNGSENHDLQDAVRGATKRLESNTQGTESTVTGSIDSFNSNGFTVDDAGTTNESGYTYVGWCWNGGGSTVTNTTGSISAQVRANPTAGFSIVSYTGTGNTSDTIGHGLGVKPDCIIVKSRNVAGQDWIVYNKNLDGGNQPATHALKLNGYGAEWDLNDVWYDTEPTSSVFTVGDEAMVNYNSSSTYIAYCFSGVEGFSKFGVYTGNGNNSGTYVYTGFRPAFVITRSLQGTSWYMFDNKRNPGNPINIELNTNNSQQDSGTGKDWMDFCSNGFKLRTNDSAVNYHNNYKYIYLAWAESPFKYARAR